VQATAHAVPAEQHHTEEARFKEERGQYFIRQQRPGHSTREVAEAASVGAELVGHDQAQDNAHAEVHGKDFRPEVVEVAVNALLGLEPKAFKYR